MRLIAGVRIGLIIATTAIAAGLYLLVRLIETPFGVRRFREAVQTFWCHACTRLLGLTVRKIGAPMSKRGAIMSNHITWIDIPVIRGSALQALEGGEIDFLSSTNY